MSTVQSPVITLTHLLLDGWTVRPAESVPQLPLLATVPATVPGCVHTDLLAARLIRQDSRRVGLSRKTFAHDITVTARAQRFAAVEAAVSRGLVDAASSGKAAERVVQAALGVSMGWPVMEMWLVDDARQVRVCAARLTTRDVTDHYERLPQHHAALVQWAMIIVMTRRLARHQHTESPY
jgi:type IV pilus biogenesis protein CpaD/CtpE